nr:redoxin domain-containing protein [Cytobacillus gottheilii]
MVQLHENMDMLADLDVDMYVISKDSPEEQLQLYNALNDEFGQSIPFISDPELELIDSMGMKNGDVAYRGYGVIDSDGNIVLTEKNDHWGEQIEDTVEDIKESVK